MMIVPSPRPIQRGTVMRSQSEFDCRRFQNKTKTSHTPMGANTTTTQKPMSGSGSKLSGGIGHQVVGVLPARQCRDASGPGLDIGKLLRAVDAGRLGVE